MAFYERQEKRGTQPPVIACCSVLSNFSCIIVLSIPNELLLVEIWREAYTDNNAKGERNVGYGAGGDSESGAKNGL